MKRIALLTALLLTNPAYAFYSTLDNGNILKAGQYQLLLAPQFILSNDTGVNISGRFDFGFDESSNFRTIVGTGTTNFFAGVMYKWIPIPDFESQPAIGLLGGIIYGVINNNSALGARIHPLISKKFDTDAGELTPYGAIPFGFQTANDETTFPIHLTLGTEYKPVGFKNISFMTEVGFNLHEAFNYITLAAVLQFDENAGLKIE